MSENARSLSDLEIEILILMRKTADSALHLSNAHLSGYFGFEMDESEIERATSHLWGLGLIEMDSQYRQTPSFLITQNGWEYLQRNGITSIDERIKTAVGWRDMAWGIVIGVAASLFTMFFVALFGLN